MTVATKPRQMGDRPDVPAAGGARRPVDLVHLARYTLGDRNLEHEVLTLFMRQADLYVARLREARHPKAWAEAAHTLKGSARSIGAWRVADAAEQAERFAGDAGGPSARRSVDLLAARVDEAKDFIRGLLAGS